MEAQVQSIASSYLEDARPSGESGIRAKCPFCGSQRAFVISLNHGGWLCFSCGERGMLITLLRRLGVPRLQIDRALEEARTVPVLSERLQRKKAVQKTWSTLPEYILAAFEGTPDELLRAGFQKEVLAAHDVGIDKTRNRITFAIRDTDGKLAAISGRARDGRMIPRYKVYDAEPPSPTRGAGEFYGVVENYKPDNRRHLYGFDAVFPERFFKPNESQPPLVITEGYKSTLWLRQLGFQHTVGLQGSSLTPGQHQQLGKLRGPYYVMLDNEPGKAFPDKKGRCAAVDIARALRRSGQVFLCLYKEGRPVGTAPDDVRGADEINEMVTGSLTLGQLYASKG
jgi:DNA primase